MKFSSSKRPRARTMPHRAQMTDLSSHAHGCVPPGVQSRGNCRPTGIHSKENSR
ncbi:hypothetical protein BURPS1710A_A0598 [Burkholderia pseudomallei 1710a]|uniref:Uncharacterized protein n=1 Tax=Burkholderia pseudomallei 1710a TaxID=320371 RepID=A0A0E1W0J4_BURPE|nr:hypothetical protein BURPS1710A_A0598 [Burkholderia pseudomallei 1710a]